MLTQLIYASRARWHTSDPAGQVALLGEMLSVSRRHNQPHGMTGFLISGGTYGMARPFRPAALDWPKQPKGRNGLCRSRCLESISVKISAA